MHFNRQSNNQLSNNLAY